MDLSIIIVNYNVRQFLENALTSLLRALEGLQGEIFVVDNASDDGSVEMIREKFSGVRLIASPTNLGFARANNLALREATGRHLLLINPDTIVQEDTLRVMTDFLDRNPDVGLAGCTILNPDGSLQLACRRSFPTPWVAFTKITGLSTLFPRSRLFGRYNLTYLNPAESYEVEAISGSFMVITRAAYERVGGLDETFFMYGEDLDWCYRVRQAGFAVYYVHRTKIIHYKGESTRRSDIDEIRLFYHAMQQFVEKHFSSSAVVEMFLTLGILLRATAAFIAKASPPFLMAVADILLVNASLIAAEWLYFGHLFRFPDYAYPVLWSVPALTVVASLLLGGLYTTHRYRVAKAGVAVLASYVIISALVFFAREFAFSRAVVLLSAAGSVILVPGWRLLARLAGARGAAAGRRSLFGRRTVIVGTGPSAEQLLRKLRARVEGGYDVLGFIAMNRRHVGERIAGVEILGSLDNIGKVIDEHRIGEVIFSTDGVSYADILGVIARSDARGVNFRMVPNSLEAVIGKTRIDELDTLPLVEIEYNLQKPVNRFIKRVFDLAVAGLLLLLVYPWVRMAHRDGALPPDGATWALLLLPRVFSGRLSIVGHPHEGGVTGGPVLPGKPGLTGLVQINRRKGLSPDEVEKYQVYYAKNQTLLLDLEILLKSLLLTKH